MDEIEMAAHFIDQAITRSRLNSLAVMLSLDCSQRVTRIAQALKLLPPGAYLLGTGPSTVGIIPLSVDEVILGRCATPSESHSDTIVDYTVADTAYFTPHEVSRVHAKVVRHQGSNGPEYALVDLSSRGGTFVNGRQLEENIESTLSPGDALSLGPNQVSTYIFWKNG